MRDRWYGDNRDLVKWATLVHLAKKNRIKRILQVAFYRKDDDIASIVTPDGPVGISPSVMQHFRSLGRIKGLESTTSLGIDVLRRPFSANGEARGRYFAELSQRLQRVRRGPLILFLDPDTGIAPKKPDARHVRPEEIKQLYAGLTKRDWLVFYQHQRRDKSWRDTTRREFAQAVGLPSEAVGVFSGKDFAKDVVFFAVRKG